MENLLLLVPLLACPIAMVAMMWLMAKGMGGGKEKNAEPEQTLAELRGERDRLAAEVERREADEERSARHGSPSHA